MTDTTTVINASVQSYLSQIGRKGGQAAARRHSFTTQSAKDAVASRWAKPGAREAHSALMRKQAMTRVRDARMDKAVKMAKGK